MVTLENDCNLSPMENFSRKFDNDDEDDEDEYQSNLPSEESDDNDSALMDDAQSEVISSSMITNGSSSLSDDEHLLIPSKNTSDHIEEFLQEKNKEKLIEYAKSFGLFDIRYRKQIWPLLIDSPPYAPIEYNHQSKSFTLTNHYYDADENEILSHRSYHQVRIDVERTLKRFPPNYTDAERLELQEELIVIIIKTLIKQKNLNYYQGYHDICLTFLLVMGRDLCLPLIDTITKSHFKDFMGPTMERTRDLLSYLMPLINSIHSDCAEYMQRGGVGNVMFALSWFITWYSHVLDNLEIILRLYDFFIVSHFLMPVYVAAEIVRYHAEQVLSIDCDMPSLHQYLTRLPSEIDLSTWEDILHRAVHLFEEHHPDTLDQMNEEWKKKCEWIENSPLDSTSTSNLKAKETDETPRPLPRIVLWGVTLTISGLAIYIWNHAQRSDPTHLISLGDFLAQLYRQ